MKIKEGLFGFSSSDYSEKISRREYSYSELATNIYRKRRAIATSKVSTASGVAAAHVTGGMSLVGSAWSGRNISVEKQKLALLEDEWARRGQTRLPKRTVKDMVIPVVIAGAIGVFTFSVDLGIANATATAAQAAAMGIPGFEFHGHLVGAEYTSIEKGAGKLGDAVNTLSSVADILLIERSTYLLRVYRYNGGRHSGESDDDEYEDDD